MKEMVCDECGTTFPKSLFENGVCVGCRAKNRYAEDEKTEKNALVVMLIGLALKGIVGLGILVLIILALIKYVF